MEEGEHGAGQGPAQDSPLGWTEPAAAQTIGGLKLARTPIGKEAGHDSPTAGTDVCNDRQSAFALCVALCDIHMFGL